MVLLAGCSSASNRRLRSFLADQRMMRMGRMGRMERMRRVRRRPVSNLSLGKRWKQRLVAEAVERVRRV
jgi:hypothetical protein